MISKVQIQIIPWFYSCRIAVEETADISSLEAFLEGNAAEDPSETQLTVERLL